ncbi:HPr kinase/phosphorylase [Profundibacter sp.]|uniref:HPr kinase/phosphorylase n=1 Tax=Profundibacter sp. TaxID=3101071 RepID=UPI003D0FF279
MNGPIVVHASCVAVEGKGVLVIGPSGSGKSALCLQLMAMGATLVADDRTELISGDSGTLARAPETIDGLIEARGVGLLAADSCVARVMLVVDMEQVETDRLPPHRTYNLLGQKAPLLHKVEAAHFPAAILQYLKGGRSA